MPVSQKRKVTKKRAVRGKPRMVLPLPESCPFASRDQLAGIDKCTLEEIEEKLIPMAEAGAIVPVGVYRFDTSELVDIRFHLLPSMAEHERQHDDWFRCYFLCLMCDPPGRPRLNHAACECKDATSAPTPGHRGQTKALLASPDGLLRPVCRFCRDLHAALAEVWASEEAGEPVSETS
ncbi:hypothetical protein ACFWIZ_05190 [Streptomyces sp. NPDC127044]